MDTGLMMMMKTIVIVIITKTIIMYYNNDDDIYYQYDVIEMQNIINKISLYDLMMEMTCLKNNQ